jgi:hypothetical protein
MMPFRDARRLAHGWLLDLADRVWPGRDGHSLCLLQQQIRQGCDEILSLRRTIERLGRRIEMERRKAAALPFEVETYLRTGNGPRAWRSAMELDRTRLNLELDSIRLREIQAGYQQRVDRLELDLRRLHELQAQVESRLGPGVNRQ